MTHYFKKTVLSLFIITGNVAFSIGTQFLALPLNAKDFTVGAHPLSSFTGSNPAGMFVNGDKPVLSAAYGKWYSDVNHSSFSLTKQRFGGTIGLLIRYAGLTGLELRSSSPTDDPLAEFGTYGAAIDLSCSRQVQKVKYGLTIRHIQMQLHTSHSSGWVMDIGVLSKIGKTSSLGFSILNVGTISKLDEESPALPIRFLLGGDTRFTGDSWTNQLFTTVEYSKNISGLIFRFGNEFDYRFLSFRLGTEVSKELATVSAGLHIQAGIYQIGYGVRFGSQGLGNPQLVDISVLLP